jgi:hypothetical protein
VPCAASRIPHVLHLARLAPTDVVWDLGCGDGRVLHQAAAQYGVRCVGVDIDAACIRTARATAAAQGVADRCAFFACDLLRLAPGALLSGVLGEAAEEAGRGVALPPPTCALVFVTGHALSRMNHFLHGEWLAAAGRLRLVTCVESLDSCVDYEANGALFDEAVERPDWPISRAAASAHGVYVTPPHGVPVDAWDAAARAHEPTAPLTRAQADLAELVLVKGLLSPAEVQAVRALGERLLLEQAAGDVASADALASLDLFDSAPAADAVSAAEACCHAAAEHRVVHLHRARAIQRELPALLERVLNRLRAEDGARWRLLRGREGGVRSAEFHVYTEGGSVVDPEHRDAGSLLTLSVLLTPADEFEGGAFLAHAPSADGGTALAPVGQLACGDGVLFASEKRHNVTPVTHGTRRTFVVELWAGAPNLHNRHH